MAKTVAVIMGIVFLLLGLSGFVLPNLLGTHLSWVHNLIHLASGAVSLYLGLRGTLAAAKLFCYGFGAFYLLLGVVGYWLGMTSTTDLPAHVAQGYNEHMFRLIPGYLELGSMDHLVHVVIGAVYLIGAIMTRRDMTKYMEDDPMSKP
jgi:hypothetical protein